MGHDTRHPASWRENIWENLSTSSSAALNSPQKSAELLFAFLVCILRSFSKDLSAGKRYFVEVAVNCMSALLCERQTMEMVQLVVR